ncbi:hypothetical protein HDV63DRAFT_321491 [Trichoderma sp. SZMC 28014]
MDLAYDHIQEEAYTKNTEEAGESSKQDQSQNSLNSDIQEAYKAISASPWGAKIGGFFGNVIKQGESVYTQASKEFAEVGEDAQKGFTSLRETIANRTRSLSLTTIIPDMSAGNDAEESQRTPTNATAPATGEESETVLTRLRAEAGKRLKDLQRAEDAADEALLKFGSNIRDFLRDAISVAPPDESAENSQVMFESKDAQGKRVIHTSRFDAQLHVIHTSTESFTKDPSAEEYEQWTEAFDIDKKTEDISGDLGKYPELRATMEKLVPDQIPYADFWKRYYFLRHGIETAESRRRDLLKAASAEDEVAWDDDDSEEEEEEEDSEEEDEDSEKPAPAKKSIANVKGKKPESIASSTTIQPPKSDESRKSNDEKSEAETDASYDVVGAASGKTSQLPTQTPNSPKDPKKKGKSDDSDEEDDSEEDSEGEDSDEDWE